MASRGHHADVGGITPGSMPPFSTCIAEEGVLIDNFKLLENGTLREAGSARIAASAGLIRRAIPRRISPICERRSPPTKRAWRSSSSWSSNTGRTVVARYMRHVQDNAEECVRRVITALHDGRVHAAARQWRADPRASRASTPSGAARASISPAPARQLPNNFNAPRAITVAAVLYVFRTLVEDEIPLNAGCLKPLRDHRSRRLHAESAAAGGGRRGQRRDLDLRDQCAVRRSAA